MKVQKNDVTLKHLLMAGDSEFARLLVGANGVRHEPTEMTVGRTIKADNLMKADDGSFWHVEFQSWNDGDMPWRMVEYKVLVLMHEHRPRQKPPSPLPIVHQILIWTGQGKNPYPSKFFHDRLTLEFDTRDLKGMFDDGRSLLTSNYLTDNILGLLCIRRSQHRSDESFLRIWRAVAEKIVRCEPLQTGRIDARMLFEFACTIREIELGRVLDEIWEWQEMAMTIDVANTRVAKQIYDQGQTNVLRRLIFEALSDRDIENPEHEFGVALDGMDASKLEELRLLEKTEIETPSLRTRILTGNSDLTTVGPSI